MAGTVRARVTSKGQVTVPKVVRERLGLRPGDALVFGMEDDRVEVRAERRRTLTEFGGMFPTGRALPRAEERDRAWRAETRRLTSRRGPAW